METLTTLTDATIEAMHGLIAANLDALQLCEVATDRVASPLMGDLFHELGEERREQLLELQTYLRHNGAPAEPEGTTLGVAHNMWTDLRAAINAGEPYVVLLEAERGEGRLEEAYRSALHEAQASPLNAVLMRHLETVRGRRAQLERLAEVAKKSATDAIV